MLPSGRTLSLWFAFDQSQTFNFRIFDLGLRKFSSSTEFILAYLDYLSHLNEDNNTRVLFERVLTAGTLEPRDSLEVWNKFLEFETNIGDLASVVKVERRRAGILEEAGIAVGENKHTIQAREPSGNKYGIFWELFSGGGGGVVRVWEKFRNNPIIFS